MDAAWSNIEARLDAIRAQLLEVAPPPASEQPPRRPRSTSSSSEVAAPPQAGAATAGPYMPRFETFQARRGDGPPAPFSTVRRRPSPPGPLRPVGYRSVHASAPAYTIRGKIVLSANLDPMQPDEYPGPGACTALAPKTAAAHSTVSLLRSCDRESRHHRRPAQVLRAVTPFSVLLRDRVLDATGLGFSGPVWSRGVTADGAREKDPLTCAIAPSHTCGPRAQPLASKPGRAFITNLQVV
jgi:hypothetical protein